MCRGGAGNNYSVAAESERHQLQYTSTLYLLSLHSFTSLPAHNHVFVVLRGHCFSFSALLPRSFVPIELEQLQSTWLSRTEQVF